ncbi:hypothetical protein [Microbacterium sp. SSM24]|uniref:hypothetical protein n=1 Tax=Microbacterium sp. SSM24 TaxID=2991714 RepID=UPI002225BEF6|nr:hypothetical protein [Microbacterium sp. SSM24]MCW3493891.1 hypothetical protein [Microbacterium sp. SSM24]
MSVLIPADDSEPSSDVGDKVEMARVPRHVWAYAQDQTDLVDAARDIRRYLQELAERASIRIHTIESRAKSLTSYQEKSGKIGADGRPKYVDPAMQIHDCVAARVIVFTMLARNDLADLISSHADVIERQNPGDLKHNGYDSEHLVIAALNKRDERDRYPALARYFDKYRGLEIQIRSVAGHAWAEYEHDVRYKSGAYQELTADGRSQIDQWFVEAGGMRHYMDELFGKIEAHLIAVDGESGSHLTSLDLADSLAPIPAIEDEDVAESDSRELDTESMRGLIRARFPEHEIGDEQATATLVAHLERLGVSTVGELETALANVEEGQVARLMDYPTETAGARRLDDELLATYQDRYVETSADEERQQFLRLRLRRVRGKFAIYSVDDGGGSSKVMTAASAVREIARIVASAEGVQAAIIADAVARTRSELLPSAKPQLVRTVQGPIYVATNFTRKQAEDIMSRLVQRVQVKPVRVYRAGDLLFDSSDAAAEADSP